MNETAFNAEIAETQRSQRENVIAFLCDLCVSAYSASKEVKGFCHE
jgi:hypothetical protein